MSNNAVSITVAAPATPLVLGGPLPAVVTLRNGSAAPVEVLLPYPDPNHLRFESSAATKKPLEWEEIERSIPVALPAGHTYSATYYLNRYLTFDRPGPAQVKYHLKALMTTSPGAPTASHESLAADGELTLTLVAGPQEALKEELSSVAVGLRSPDRQRKIEAAEALAFLETPLALEYQARMLTIDGLETTGIQALGRSSSAPAHQLIVGMLAHRDATIVATAFGEIDRLHLAVPRERVWPLAQSDDASIRWAAVDWMATHPDPRDREALSPLLHDPNEAVRERARSYVEALPK